MIDWKKIKLRTFSVINAVYILRRLTMFFHIYIPIRDFLFKRQLEKQQYVYAYGNNELRGVIDKLNDILRNGQFKVTSYQYYEFSTCFCHNCNHEYFDNNECRKCCGLWPLPSHFDPKDNDMVLIDWLI